MANFISIFRVFLVFISIYLLFTSSFAAYMWAFALTIIAFACDGLDGYVARKYNEVSKFGSVLDIMSDRIAEYSYWIAFAVLGWIPLVFPLIALTRGIITDGIRSVAMEQGMTAFGENSMQESKLSKFICGSKFMRITYAVAKVFAFMLFILAYVPSLPKDIAAVINVVAYVFALIAIFLCVLRGIPVVLESKKLFGKEEQAN